MNLRNLISFLRGKTNAKIGLRRECNDMLTVELSEKEVGLEELEVWLESYFRSYPRRNTPFGFIAFDIVGEEFLFVTRTASKEFTSPEPLLLSFVTIQKIKASKEMMKRISLRYPLSI